MAASTLDKSSPEASLGTPFGDEVPSVLAQAGQGASKVTTTKEQEQGQEQAQKQKKVTPTAAMQTPSAAAAEPGPPRMTRLPSLQQLSQRLHAPALPTQTPSSTSTTTETTTTPPKLSLATHPAVLGTPSGRNSITSPFAQSPSSRLKLPASAMLRSLSHGGTSSSPSSAFPTLASTQPGLRREGSLSLGNIKGETLPHAPDVFSTTTNTIIPSARSSEDKENLPSASSSPAPSMARQPSKEYIQGYKDVPSLAAIRHRVSISRGKSISGPASIPQLEEQMRAAAAAKAKDDEVAQAVSTAGSEMEAKAVEHPLQHTWTLYFDSKTFKPDPALAAQQGNESLGDYEKTLVTVGKFETVEGFARHLNNVRLPSQLARNSNYHMFKNGIRPMWEDPANADGGKWVLLIRSAPHLLDSAWASLTMALVGEVLDPSDEVCGVVASTRPKIDRIQVWTRARDDAERINALGRRILECVGEEAERGHMSLEFQYNASNAHPPPNKFMHLAFSSHHLGRPSSSSASASSGLSILAPTPYSQGLPQPQSHHHLPPTPSRLSHPPPNPTSSPLLQPPPLSPSLPAKPQGSPRLASTAMTDRQLMPPPVGMGGMGMKRMGSGGAGSNAFAGPMIGGGAGRTSPMRKQVGA